MLDSLYSALFSSADTSTGARLSIAWGVWVIIGAVLALNAAGAIGLGAKGVLALAVAFILAGLIGWYWLAASIGLLARLLGGQGDVQATMAAIAQSLWPLLLTAPVIGIKAWLPGLGELLSLVIVFWVVGILIREIRQVHRLSWGRSALCFVLTLALAVLAPVGLILWPLMIILGT